MFNRIFATLAAVAVRRDRHAVTLPHACGRGLHHGTADFIACQISAKGGQRHCGVTVDDEASAIEGAQTVSQRLALRAGLKILDVQ
jgi:hypothetical protein